MDFKILIIILVSGNSRERSEERFNGKAST